MVACERQDSRALIGYAPVKLPALTLLAKQWLLAVINVVDQVFRADSDTL